VVNRRRRRGQHVGVGCEIVGGNGGLVGSGIGEVVDVFLGKRPA
jgi:hypothetical protein